MASFFSPKASQGGCLFLLFLMYNRSSSTIARVDKTHLRPASCLCPVSTTAAAVLTLLAMPALGPDRPAGYYNLTDDGPVTTYYRRDAELRTRTGRREARKP